MKPIEFSDNLDVGWERKRGVKNDAQEGKQSTLTRVEEDYLEFVFRSFDFEISLRSSRQLITESGIQKRSGSCWQTDSM